MSNIVLNAGSGGSTLGTDLVAGVDYQKVKVTFSTDGVAPQSVDATHQLPVLATQTGTWNITNISGTVTLPTGAATAAKQPALGTAGSASADVITIQGIASMTKLLVTPDSVALPANQSVNLNQIAGTTPDTNSGTKSAGTLRVVLATDQPALTNKLLVTPDSVALPANQSVNVSQINAVTPLMGNGVTGTGSQRVTIASDNTAFSVNAVQSGTWTVQPGNTANTTAWLVNDQPAASGGLSFNSFVGAASNNKTQIKGSAGQLYLVSVQNLAATPVYLKVFNATAASVNAGTTNCDFQFMIPGNTAGAGLVLNIDKGIALGTAITVMLTAAIATNDNTSVSANQQVVTIGYK